MATPTPTPHDWQEAKGIGFYLLGVDFPGGRREMSITYDADRYPTADALMSAVLSDPSWRNRYEVLESSTITARHRLLCVRTRKVQ